MITHVRDSLSHSLSLDIIRFLDLSPPLCIQYDKKANPFEKKDLKATAEGRLQVSPGYLANPDLQMKLIRSVNKKSWFLFPGSTKELREEIFKGKKMDITYETPLSLPIKRDAVKVTAVKLHMNHGIQLLRHDGDGKRWNLLGESGYISMMKITGTHLYFRKKDNPQEVESGLWENIFLFSIKFVIEGYHSEYFLKKRSKVDILSCFEIVTEEGRSLLFEILKPKDEEVVKRREYVAAETARISKYDPEKLWDEKYMSKIPQNYKDKILAEKKRTEEQNRINRKKNKENEAAGIEERFPVEEEATEEEVCLRRQKFCELIVGSLKSIVDEIRGSKVFLGPDGMPQRRVAAKEVLKKNG